MKNKPIKNEEVKPTHSDKENTSPESRAEDRARTVPTGAPTKPAPTDASRGTSMPARKE